MIYLTFKFLWRIMWIDVCANWIYQTVGKTLHDLSHWSDKYLIGVGRILRYFSKLKLIKSWFSVGILDDKNIVTGLKRIRIDSSSTTKFMDSHFQTNGVLVSVFRQTNYFMWMFSGSNYILFCMKVTNRQGLLDFQICVNNWTTIW